jgi:hypothetical protein
MPEWLNGTVSKIVVGATLPRVRIPLSPYFFVKLIIDIVRSIPVLKQTIALIGITGIILLELILYIYVPCWRDDREAEGARLESVCTRKGTEGSNPSLSVFTPLVYARTYAINQHLTPPGPEGSNGK